MLDYLVARSVRHRWLVLLAVAAWVWYPQGRNLDSAGALSYRITRGRAAIALITAHPVEDDPASVWRPCRRPDGAKAVG